uniref:Uncharacterized protein n=1 Tax=viral metagenome TaxID=1070528 RepID=A0A6H1ZY53_9ZZZZ
MKTVNEVAQLADDMRKCKTHEELDKFVEEKISPIVKELGEFVDFLRYEYRGIKLLIRYNNINYMDILNTEGKKRMKE